MCLLHLAILCVRRGDRIGGYCHYAFELLVEVVKEQKVYAEEEPIFLQQKLTDGGLS